jgi:hypothetical protein
MELALVLCQCSHQLLVPDVKLTPADTTSSDIGGPQCMLHRHYQRILILVQGSQFGYYQSLRGTIPGQLTGFQSHYNTLKHNDVLECAFKLHRQYAAAKASLLHPSPLSSTSWTNHPLRNDKEKSWLVGATRAH